MSSKWTAAEIPDQSGRVAVVTGANSGLGLATARELARAGAEVVIASRNTDKGAEAVDRIAAAVTAPKLELQQLDLADLSSVRAFAARLADNLERLILREGPDTIAAFFAEPVMGAGGVIVPPATYFDRIQPILKKYEILFVADEVICGFGRTGNMFGTQTFNLQPDIITVAKALSAGYLPISGTLVSDALYEILVTQSDKLGIFGHGYTYSSHPVPAAVALETLKIYEERDIVAAVRRVGPRLQEAIRSYSRHPLIGDARGIGLIGAMELVRDKATKERFDPKAGVAAYLVRRAQQHGVILRNMPGDIIAFCPPLIISEAEIDEMMGCFAKALADTSAMVKEKGLT